MTEALKIEVGRSYRDASGNKVTIAREVGLGVVVADSGVTYAPDGNTYFFVSGYADIKLVAEWSEYDMSANTKIRRSTPAEIERAEILAAIQSCAPSDVPYSAAKHEWARLGKKELFAQILKAIEIAHLAADGTSAAPETKPEEGR